MKITKFELRAPDSDGEMSTDVAALIDNPTTEEVRWLEYIAVLSDKDGFPLSCWRNTEDCTIDIGEEFAVDPHGSPVQSQVAGGARNNITVSVSAILHAREFYKLGEVEAPAADRGFARIEKAVTSSTIDGALNVLIFRHKTDEQGQTCLECRVTIRNVSDLHLARVQLKWDLVDAEDSITESGSDEIAVQARSLGCLESSIGWYKKSQFKGAKVRLSLYVFRPVHAAHCSGTSTPSKD